MMNNKLISVIVPVYNVEHYLNRCVDSILAQTYSDLEILLVDDGSTDNSGAICDAYARQDARVQVIHKKNAGQAAARNDAIDIARGSYLGFVDSDDFIDCRMFEILYQDLTEHDAQISIVTFQEFTEEKEVTVSRNLMSIECQAGEKILQKLLLEEKIGDFSWNKLYRRELFKEIRYPVGRMMEDQGIMYKLVDQCTKVTYRPIRLYFYYQRPDSTLHRRTLKFYEDKWDMGCQRYQYIRKKYPDMLENDAAMMKIVEHCYPYLRKDQRRKAEMERFLQEFRTEAEGLLDSGFMRKYRLLKQSRGLYSALFLLKNGRAAK